MAVPQIDNGKKPRELLNVAHTPALPSETPYGNLSLKGTKIVRRIDRINLEIERVFSSYVQPRATNFDPFQDILEHQFYAEQVIYWLRKTADELISLAYVLCERKNNGEWPSSIKVDSIAGLKKNPPPEVKALFSPHEDLLETLNEVANVFKHSFVNTDISVVGIEFPVVYALALDRNNLANEVRPHQVSFGDLVKGFSELYKATMPMIEAWGHEGLNRHGKRTSLPIPPRNNPGGNSS